jgi:hypothetical protein
LQQYPSMTLPTSQITGAASISDPTFSVRTQTMVHIDGPRDLMRHYRQFVGVRRKFSTNLNTRLLNNQENP